MDRPRGRIIEDRELVVIARVKPARIEQLRSCRGLGRRTVSRYADAILSAVEHARNLPAHAMPAPASRGSARRVPKERVDVVASEIQSLSQPHGIDAPLVATKGEIARLLFEGADAAPEKHRLLRGWRAELFAPLLDRHLEPEPQQQLF